MSPTMTVGRRQAEDLMFLLAGQAAGLARPLPAAELVQTLARETETVIASH
jgi:hypothetical protein